MSNIGISQPPPPPGPPIPLQITNYSSEIIVVRAVEMEGCNSNVVVSTAYTVYPSSTIMVYPTIASSPTNLQHWMGLMVHWWPSLPLVMTSFANPYTNCTTISTLQITNDPQVSWPSQYVIDIY